MSTQSTARSWRSLSAPVKRYSIALGLLALSIMAGAVAFAGVLIACLALYVQRYGHSMTYSQDYIAGLATFIAPTLSFLIATVGASAGLVSIRTRLFTIVVIFVGLVLLIVAVTNPGFLDTL